MAKLFQHGGKLDAANEAGAAVSDLSLATPKFPKPKIFMLDVEASAEAMLVKSGFNVLHGSFGRPYKIAKGDGYEPVIVKPDFPPYSEQEIIVIDLSFSSVADGPEGEKHAPSSERDWWAKCNRDFIDPRPRSMISVMQEFDRIFGHGGAFVIFADKTIKQELVLAYSSNYGLQGGENIPFDNWSFVSALRQFEITSDFGTEITFDRSTTLGRILADDADNTQFTCTIKAGYPWHNKWTQVGTSKYGAAVAGYFVDPASKGSITIVPQVSNKGQFLIRLLKDFIPDISPHLFPDFEGAKWIHRQEYELPTVIALQDEVLRVEAEYQKKCDGLQNAIVEAQHKDAYLYALISETGTALVDAVKEALNKLGFEKVIDVDVAEHQAGNANSLREDLQIHDTTPTLVVDIKGIGGIPADADALQAQKHAFIRIKEWKRVDVKGLTIINHQRHIPGLERDNDHAFRQEILHNADEVELGLMTTWDLWRMLRNTQKLGWKLKNVRPLFYRTGRIEIIPEHYALTGVIEHLWKGIIGIRVTHDPIKIGDMLAFEGVVEFEEERVNSMQINGKSVEIAEVGDGVGVQTILAKPNIKEGMRVFRITGDK